MEHITLNKTLQNIEKCYKSWSKWFIFITDDTYLRKLFKLQKTVNLIINMGDYS